MTRPRVAWSDARSFSVVLAMAAAYAALPLAVARGPAQGGLVLVAISIGVASAASGPSPIAIMAGSLAAVSIGLVARISVPLAGGCFLCLALAARTLRVQGALARAAHVVLAFGGGAVAATLAFGFAGAPLAARVAALALSSVAASIPMLVATAEPRHVELRRVAEQLGQTAADLDRLGGVLREIERAPGPGGPYRAG